MTASPLGDSPRQPQRELPRRNYTDLFVPAEKAIWNATQAVEEAGAHPHLTDAVVLLAQAREKVADWVDGVPLGEPAPVSASPETADPTTERLEEIERRVITWDTPYHGRTILMTDYDWLRQTVRDLQQQVATLTEERLMLAKLAARTPQFFNPILVWEAESLRDRLLSGGEEKPA